MMIVPSSYPAAGAESKARTGRRARSASATDALHHDGGRPSFGVSPLLWPRGRYCLQREKGRREAAVEFWAEPFRITGRREKQRADVVSG